MPRQRAATSLHAGCLLGMLLLMNGTPSTAAQPLNLRDYMALTGPAPSAHMPYGDAPSQYAELFLPAGAGPFPVAVLVHGGCWTKEFAGIRQMRNMAGALAAQGIAVWNVEYRRVDEAGGGYPGTYRDIAAALDLLVAAAAAQRLDLSHMVAIGHSAGGHLVQWLAGRALIGAASPLHQTRPVPVRQIVALGSIGDLRARLDPDDTVCGVDIAKLTGFPDAVRPNVYADTNPADLMPNGSHTVLINGALDTVSPPRTAVDYAARARAAGDSVETLVLPGASHYDEVAVSSAGWPRILAVIRAALGMPAAG